MDQEAWKFVEAALPERGIALREVRRLLEKAVPGAANTSKTNDFRSSADKLSEKGAGHSVATTLASGGVSTLVEGYSSSLDDDLMLGIQASSLIAMDSSSQTTQTTPILPGVQGKGGC